MPFNEPMMGLMGLSAFGGQQESPEESDLWDQLAAFEFSKLSKKDKKEALSMALIASGGAMLSGKNFMQGMGAAGQAFAGTYSDQLKGLRGEKRDEDLIRYKSMLAEAQRADEESRFQRKQEEIERANLATEELSGERVDLAGEANEISQGRLDAQLAADKITREQIERQNQQQDEARQLIEAITQGMGPDGGGLPLTPQELAQAGFDLQDDTTQGIKQYAGVYQRYNPTTGEMELIPTSDEASALIDERLSMTEAGRESNLITKKIKENNAVIEDLNSRAFEDGQPALRGNDRAAAIRRMEELRKENDQLRQTLMTLGMGERDGLTEAERAFLTANGINPDELEE
jgi:hypothetical protein